MIASVRRTSLLAGLRSQNNCAELLGVGIGSEQLLEFADWTFFKRVIGENIEIIKQIVEKLAKLPFGRLRREYLVRETHALL
jgi:hypothetical protein